MTDRNRFDPFTNYTQSRQVMISMYYPSRPNYFPVVAEKNAKADRQHRTVPYMPPLTATLYDELIVQFSFPSDTFALLSVSCQQNARPLGKPSTYPLLIFSPGGGAPRFFYTAVLESLASRGYVVVAIDHPYDALVVEFPDGPAIIGLKKTLTRDEVELLVTVRAQDISFVLDELTRRLPNKFQTSDVVAFGHSLGSGAVAEAMLNDTRIKGGINLDGRLFGSMERPNITLCKPFLQFSSERSSSDPYMRWNEEWERLSGWRLELVLSGAAHLTFTDMPLIAEFLNV